MHSSCNFLKNATRKRHFVLVSSLKLSIFAQGLVTLLLRTISSCFDEDFFNYAL